MTELSPEMSVHVHDEEQVSTRRYGELEVVVHQSAEALGRGAAGRAAAAIRKEVDSRGRAAVVLATGNSQRGFLASLTSFELPWEKVSILHMDEYVGISEDHPASFRRYLREHIVEPVQPAAFYGIEGDAPDLEAELRRYEALLRAQEPCLCVLGIGENGHLAFNDPPADFHTTELVHEVTLDEACRRQQVGEGYFPDVAVVPARALSLTVPALLAPPTVIAVVPEARKAAAVRNTLEGPVSPACPASALRGAPNASLHLDPDSAGLLTASRS